MNGRKTEKIRFRDMFSELSLYIIVAVLGISLILFLLGLMNISILKGLHPDFDTAYYWYNEFSVAGKETVKVIAIVFLYELLLKMFRIK